MQELRGVHFGSYWMGKNDIVYLMAQDLAGMCNLLIIDTGIYDNNKSDWYEEDYQFNYANPVRWIDHDKVLSITSRHKANFVVVNAGGMSLHPETIDALHKENILCLGISLSDPDVFPYNGKIYSNLYDLYYTNSAYSLKHQYDKNINIRLLPFAASSKLHRPILEFKKKYDVVVVGHARPDRMEVVNLLKRYFSVGLFGSGWGREYFPVNGEAHVQAINSGKMYLSFSKTVAGFTNVKVGLFEAAACRTMLITQFFNEMEAYFRYGLEIIGYTDIDELVKIADFYLKNEHLRNCIAQNSYDRFLKEHTWERRWEGILINIKEISK